MDGSESLRQPGFEKVQELAKNVVSLFKISKQATHVGLLEFSSEVSRKLALDKLYEVGQVKNAIDAIEPSGGDATVTDKMLKEAEQVFAAANGGRPDATKALVVITDSKSTGKTPLREAAERLKEKGIRVVVVDIGERTDPRELRDLTSSDKYVKKAKSPKEAAKLGGEVANSVLKDYKQS